MASRIKRKEHITKARKKQILNAALSVFSSKGFGEATIADVAAHAGVGIGTIYNYYKDKHDLLISLIAQSLLSENLLKVLDALPTQSNEDFMQSLLEERLEVGLEDAQNIIFMFFEIQRDAKLRRQYITQVVSPILHRVEDYIRVQVDKGNFRHVDEKIVARTITGSIIGSMILYRLELKDSPFKKSRIKETAREISSLFLYGLSEK